MAWRGCFLRRHGRHGGGGSNAVGAFAQGLEMNAKLCGSTCTKSKAKSGVSLRLVDRKFLELSYQPLIIPLTMMINQVLCLGKIQVTDEESYES